MTPPLSRIPDGEAPHALIPERLRKLLQEGELPFREFMELALYAPGEGYYEQAVNPVSKDGDYVTAGAISPVFAFALARLGDEFVARTGDGLCSIVDIGCGSGELVRELARQMSPHHRDRAVFHGIDRSLARVDVGGRSSLGGRSSCSDGRTGASPDDEELLAERSGGQEPAGLSREDARPPRDARPPVEAQHSPAVHFSTTLEAVDWSAPVLVLSNELFDAFPVARLVQRAGGLHELTVRMEDDRLDWGERQAPPEYVRYFADRGIVLTEGQFADISLEWERFYGAVARRLGRGLIVTIDYGYPENKLFSSRARRFGTAASFFGHQVHRDLLARPGRQDLTAHINFTDLERAGEREGLRTLSFQRQASFLLSLGITSHPLFRPLTDEEFASLGDAVERMDERHAARRLILPEGIGEEMKVLIQGKDAGEEPWSFTHGIV